MGPAADSVDLKLLSGVPLVMPTALHVTRQPLELAAAQHRVTLDIKYEIDAVESLFELVNDGFAYTVSTGIAISSGWVKPHLVKQRIVNPSITTELFLVSPLPQNMTPLQERALSLARSIFKSKIEKIGC
ncbi:LysR substrate binding domain protein [compost metagenome]